MSLPASFGELIGTGAGIGVGGAAGYVVLKWFIEWLGGRVDKREAAVDARQTKLDEATQALIDHLQKQITDQAERFAAQSAEQNMRLQAALDRIDAVEAELEECRAQHAEAEARATKYEAMMQGLGDARDKAAAAMAADRLADLGG